jgi:CRISPR-associated protein Cst2
MKLWSISFAYKLGLGFHALNNEGADGSNLMQPRQIDVGSSIYDGISGAIVRHHILEKFVLLCEQNNVPVLPLSAGLHPDRGPLGIRAAAKQSGVEQLAKDNLLPAVRSALVKCAVIDVGGYLAAWQETASQAYVAEKNYIDTSCAELASKPNIPEPIKRESCFDVGWLISTAPHERTVTEHSAFRDTASLNSRYAQTMRSNVYGGIVRAELHRVGIDDHWYLLPGKDGKGRADRLAIDKKEQQNRQCALVRAIAEFIAAPSGAKMAAWAPHVYLTEGAILLSEARTAPFVSPVRVDLANGSEQPVRENPDYRDKMQATANQKDSWCWVFDDAKALREAVDKIDNKLRS